MSDFLAQANLTLVSPGNKEAAIDTGYASDLLSDAIANAPANSIFITVQAHKNTVAVATLVGIPLIILCNSRTAPSDMIDAADDKGIGIAQSEMTQYQACIMVNTILSKVM